jgi:thiamine pyrophosphokinase
MNDKIKGQIRAVLKGEAKLEEAAEGVHLSVDHVEQRIREVMSRGIIFSGDHLDDLIMAGYWRGRSDQFVASMTHLFGKEEFEKLYNQTCLEMGISPKRLN